MQLVVPIAVRILHNLLLSFSSHRFHYFFVTQKFTEITEILRPPDYYKK